MKTALISKHKITNELFYSFCWSYYPKEEKRLDYAASNNKMEYDLAEEIARDSSIGPI